jgi:hypothetical protein
MVFFATVKGAMSIPWHHFVRLFSLPLLLIGSVRADASAKPLVFALRTASRPILEGTWSQLKSDWSVRLGQGDGTLVSGADVLSVRRGDVPLPPLPMEDHLILANGDRIPFRGLWLNEEKLHFRHVNLDQGRDVSLPLAAVSVLWYIAPDKTLDAERLRRRLTAGTRKHDTVCLRNGDVLAGMLASLDTENAVVEVDKRRVTVKVPQVAYIAFNTELADAMRPKGSFARLVIVDKHLRHAGRISLTSATADETTLTGTTVFGAQVRVPLRDIASLDVLQGNSVYLSDLKESKYTFQPFLNATWPFAVDGNVADHDLLLAGSTYDKGIGMHSHSQLTYRLSRPYRRFEALAGLDDKDGKGGDVRLRVLGDGKTLLDRASTSRDGAIPIHLSMEGVHELTLEVDFGRNGDVRDVVNWVDARLVK